MNGAFSVAVVGGLVGAFAGGLTKFVWELVVALVADHASRPAG